MIRTIVSRPVEIIMKRFILVLLIVLGALAWSNPSHADHQRAFGDKFKEDNPIISWLGGAKVASELVGYDSYVIFSVGRVADQPVSVGLFGRVFAREIPIEAEIGKAFRDAMSAD